MTWIRKRDHSLLSNAASLLVCGLLAGFVVAAAAFPAVAMSGLAAKAGADTFDHLPSELSVLVWERGAGETLASGSSSVAAASAAITQGWCGNPARVHLPGGTLEVELRGTRAHLTGPAVEVFHGELSSP